MSVRKLTTRIFAMTILFVSMVGGSSLFAQTGFPAADPLEFDPDFRWFEPVNQFDFDDMKPLQRRGSGWFATYDRLNLHGSRPETDDNNASETKIDSGWGHRYEFGYMVPSENTGWMFTWTENDVAQYFEVARERLNRVNLDDLNGAPTNAAPPFGFIVPRGDGNNLGLSTRTIFIRDSENVVDYDAYELNRTWRMKPYRYGGILEPMVGFRWIRLTDTNLRDTFNSFLDPIPFTFQGNEAEQLIRDQTFTENEILTGQVGFHYTRFRNRFIFSGDFRVFTGPSLQCSKSNQTVEIVEYDGDALGDEVTRIVNSATAPLYQRNEEWSVGFDLRGEIGYQLTKQISIRGGFQVIDIATGVWRGGPQNQNFLPGGDQNQDYLMFGGTFGLALNH